jgi:pyruvate decarboxylase
VEWTDGQRVITTCVVKSKPVVIFLPYDIVSQPVDAARLKTPLGLIPPRDEIVEDEVVLKILEAIYSARRPMILADVLTSRFHSISQVRELVKVTQFPVLSSSDR